MESGRYGSPSKRALPGNGGYLEYLLAGESDRKADLYVPSLVPMHYRRSDTFIPEFSMDPLEQQTLSEITRRNQEWFDWNWTNTATYMDTFAEKHNLNVMAVLPLNVSHGTTRKPDVTMFPNNLDQMQEVNAGQQGTDEANGETTYNTLVSFLGRVMYNYDNRYYISASLRADGSSRFPKGNKYALFLLYLLPGVSSAKDSCRIRKSSMI